MNTDIVRELGFLTLGTRLKRIGERLQAHTQQLLGSSGLALPASHFPALAALDRLGPLSVGQIAQAIGVSQPGVTRQLGNLEAAGYVEAEAAGADLRLRTIRLTGAGRQLITHAKRSSWPVIEAAVADACGAGGRTLLAQLAALEDALEAQTLGERAERLAAAPRRKRHATA